MKKEELLLSLREMKIKIMGMIDELLENGHIIDSLVEQIEKD